MPKSTGWCRSYSVPKLLVPNIDCPFWVSPEPNQTQSLGPKPIVPKPKCTKTQQKSWTRFYPFKILSDLFKNPRSCKTGEKILPVIGCQDRVNILVPFNHFCVISGFHLKIIISKKFKEISIFKSFKNSKQSDRSCCQKLKFSKGLYLITSFMHKIFACI